MRALGLEVAARANDAPDDAGAERYAVAVQVTDPARVPHAVETLARLLGVNADAALRMLATPPGQILGGIGRAAADAVAARFGAGCEVRRARDGAGPFDVHVPPGAAPPALRALVGERRGLVLLGLDADAAAALHARLPRGGPALVPRALLRFDAVLAATPPMRADGPAALAALFDVPVAVARTAQAHAPLALAERLEHAAAEALVARARASGLPVSLAASGFERCDLRVEAAHDRAALSAVLRAAGHAAPDRLPARVARDLGDLDARWLAHSLERAGARVAFAAPATEAAA